MGSNIYDQIVRDFIRYGDRQSANANKLSEQIRLVEEELRSMEKSDITENFNYNEEVDKLKGLYFKVSKYKYWERYYKSFKQKLLESGIREDKTGSDIIDVGSIVKYTVKNRKIIALIVPAHLSNRKIGAIGIDTPAGDALRGKHSGDIVTIASKDLQFKIEEVL